MARIFNRAYNQADRILNGSGLSSIVHRQGGGGMITSVYGKPIPRYTYRDNGGPVIRRFGGGGYSDEDAGVEETSYGGGVEDWGISSADMEAAYSTGAFGPEVAEKSFFDPPDIEDQRVHGTSPHDIYRHGEAYGKPPGSQPAEPTGLDDYRDRDQNFIESIIGLFTNKPKGLQPSPEMQRRMEAYRQEGLRGMMQGGFKSPQAYRDYMQNWATEAEKARSDAYWDQYPQGHWVTETHGGTKGTSLVLPEQAPISKNEAIDNVLADDTLSPEEKQKQIDYIFTWGPVVNRDMGRLEKAHRQHRENMKARDRAKGGKVMPGGLSNIKKSININGQPHSLAWIRPDEASALKAMGGSGKKVDGIPAYYFDDPDSWTDATAFTPIEQATADYFDSINYGSGIDTLEKQVDKTVRTPSFTKGPLGVNSAIIANLMQQGKTYDQVMRDLGTPVSDKPALSSSDAYTDPDSMSGSEPPTEDARLTDQYRHGIFGKLLGQDPMTRSEAEQMAYNQGFNAWRAGPGAFSLDAPKDYMDWFDKNKDAMVEGIGLAIGPTGHAMRTSLDLINQQLQNKFTERGMQKSEFTQDELTREELQDAVKDIKDLEDFEPYDGIDWPVWAPGGFATGALNFFSRTVIGTGTVNGVRVHVHEDGTVTPISYEDTPGFDRSTLETGNEPITRRKRRPVTASVSEEVIEKEPTGIAGLQAKRSEVASIGQSLQPQFDNLARIFGREKAAKMLNQPENIFGIG
jgi:hypothetical protein